MTTTTNLGITLLEQGQAQKEVTINEALTALDAFVNGSVLDKDLATPPASPVTGAAYIVAASPTGAWVGHTNHIAYFNQVWRFVVPQAGARIWVMDEATNYAFNGTAWAIQGNMSGGAIATALTSQNLDNVARIGIGTTDAGNKLSVSGNSVLFNSATGDIRTTLNKSATGNNALFSFQNGFSTRAEFGLAGNDDFTMKVSPNGSSFNNGMIINGTTAAVNFPSTALVTSASATAFAVGANGTTNPALQVDASAASSVTGVAVQSTATGATTGPVLQAISSAANENITLRAKGTGITYLDTSSASGSVNIRNNGGTRVTFGSVNSTFTPSTSTAANTVRFGYTGGADTAMTASTEAPSVYFNMGQTRQHATGNITLQRDFRVTGSVHSAAAASVFTDVAAFAVDGPSAAGTNATITNSHGIYVPTTVLTGTVTNADALNVAAPTGAINNYAIQATGRNALTSGSTLEVYNTADQVTNYERVKYSWVSNIYTISTESGGTGSLRNLQIGTSSRKMVFNEAGGSAGFYQFPSGTSGVGSTGSVFGSASSAWSAASGTNRIVQIAPNINQSGTAAYTALEINPTETTVGTGVRNLLDLQVGGVSLFSIQSSGKTTWQATNTATGTTGAQTINKPSGTVNFAAGASSLVVTNSLCTTASIVMPVLRTNDATARIANVVPAAGSFTINLTAAATAETSCGFHIIN